MTALRAEDVKAAESDVQKNLQFKKKNLHHAQVIRFYEAKCQNNFVLINLELASGCLIDEVLKGMCAALCKRYFLELISGFEYMHSLCVAHRDIKSENFLIGRDGRLKLADFGLATRFLSGKMVEAMCGTLQYNRPTFGPVESFLLKC